MQQRTVIWLVAIAIALLAGAIAFAAEPKDVDEEAPGFDENDVSIDRGDVLEPGRYEGSVNERIDLEGRIESKRNRNFEPLRDDATRRVETNRTESLPGRF